jgi:small subunit ribosomal protein S20
MANHPSAEKRNRQRIVRALRNRSTMSALRTAVKQARQAIAGGGAEAARERVAQASQALAKAAQKGVIRPQTAARTTSRIQKALHKLGSAE